MAVCSDDARPKPGGLTLGAGADTAHKGDRAHDAADDRASDAGAYDQEGSDSKGSYNIHVNLLVGYRGIAMQYCN
jgi:hypothetical protein